MASFIPSLLVNLFSSSKLASLSPEYLLLNKSTSHFQLTALRFTGWPFESHKKKEEGNFESIHFLALLNVAAII
jgi:hypothetical protein